MKKPEKTLNEQISEMAMLQFTDREIATITQLDPDALIRGYSSDIDRGRLLAEAEVRKSVLQMAKQGSTPAQKQFMDLNKRAKNLKLKRPL